MTNTDTSDYRRFPRQSQYLFNRFDLERSCLAQMAMNGFSSLKMILSDGQFHRFSTDDDQKKKDEWYVAHSWIFEGKEYLIAHYGSWCNPDVKYRYESWKEGENESLSDRAQFELSRYLQEIEQKSDEERVKRHKEAAAEAIDLWKDALRKPSTDGHSAYLKLKRVGAHTIRFGKNPNGYDAIILPLWNIEGKLRSLQFISVGQANGKVYKSFLAGGEKKGCFCVLGDLKKAGSFYVAEGYATAASVYESDKLPVVIAFDCGNLESVISCLKEKYSQSQIIIAGDDDRETEGNPGRAKAELAARRHGCCVVFPRFPQELRLQNEKKLTDFNDLHALVGIDEVKKQLQEIPMDQKDDNRRTDKTDFVSSGGWGEPIEFQDKLPSVPVFNSFLLPDPFRCYAEDVADRIQCSIDFIVVPLLVMTSSLIGAGCAMRPKQFDNWTVIPNLWGGIIGPPSVMKSPALSEGMFALGVLEREADKKYEEDCLTGKIDAMEAGLRKDELSSNLKKAIKGENEREIEAFKAALTKLEKEEKTAIWKRYKTNDATIEKLSEILQDNPRGILVYRDELIGFLNSLDKDGREGDRAFYLEGWNGYSSAPVKSDRIARGTISSNPCISILGGIQPSKLRRYLSDAVTDIANDGLLQRFQMLVYPDKPKTFKFIDRKPNYQIREKVVEIARTIAGTDFISMGANFEEKFSIPVLRFDPAAQEFFNTWMTTLKERLLNDSDEGVFVEHLAKYPKLMPSLALISYLIRVAYGDSPSSVSFEDARRAADICAYLEAHAKRIYSILDHRGMLRAKTLLRKLQEGALLDGFTSRDVYRKEWSGLASSKEASEACKELVERGWLKEENVFSTPNGGAPTIRHYLHPILLKKRNSQPDKTDRTEDE